MHLGPAVFAFALLSVLPAQKAPVPSPQPQPAPIQVTPNAWFQTVYQRAEVPAGSNKVAASFPFQNPTDKAVEWTECTASCACSHLEFTVGDRRYWLKPKPKELVQLIVKDPGAEPVREPVASIPIGPGEKGTVEVHIEITGQQGHKSVLVDIHGNDPATPQTKLQVEAAHALSLQVTPPDIDLGLVPPGEVRQWAAEVTSTGQKDFEVTPPLQLPAGVTARCAKTVNNGIAVWSIQGTYGPFQAGQGGAVQLKFGTSIPGENGFNLRIAARVAAAVEMTPGFLTLGRVDPKVGAKALVRFHSNDDSDLHAVAVELANVTPEGAKVEATARKDGRDVVIDIVVPAGVANGLLRGDLRVELDHATSKSFKVLFNGFVR